MPECFFEFSFLFKSRRSILIMLILQTLFICSFELSCDGVLDSYIVQAFKCLSQSVLFICFEIIGWTFR